MFYILLFSWLLLTVIPIYNSFTAPKLKKVRLINKNNPLVSILIPARNEEKNIKSCLENILKQNYNNFEIIVLNDNSNDKTLEVVEKLSTKNSKIKIIQGAELPAGWTGKNWACHQLSKEAKGNLLLFIDADVILEESAISSAVSEFLKYDLNMLTCFPTQVTKSFGEKSIIPIMNWILLAFLPLIQVYKSKLKSFSGANGQFIMFDKENYFKLGGHERVKNKVAEDISLCLLYKSNKYKVLTCLGNNIVRCRMYRNLRESFNGFSKNFYIGSHTPLLIFIVFLFFMIFINLAPFILVFTNLKFLIIVTIIIFNKAIVAKLSNTNIFENIYFHLIHSIFLFILGINSLRITLLKKIVWKDRIIK